MWLLVLSRILFTSAGGLRIGRSLSRKKSEIKKTSAFPRNITLTPAKLEPAVETLRQKADKIKLKKE
jgi:hypothetical protein